MKHYPMMIKKTCKIIFILNDDLLFFYKKEKKLFILKPVLKSIYFNFQFQIFYYYYSCYYIIWFCFSIILYKQIQKYFFENSEKWRQKTLLFSLKNDLFNFISLFWFLIIIYVFFDCLIELLFSIKQYDVKKTEKKPKFKKKPIEIENSLYLHSFLIYHGFTLFKLLFW